MEETKVLLVAYFTRIISPHQNKECLIKWTQIGLLLGTPRMIPR